MSYAYVNHGRWVAHCDTPYCSGAEKWWPGGVLHTDEDGREHGLTPETLVCHNCGLTSDVEWPRDRHRIDTILARRPVPQTRNWFPGETLSDLRLENAGHGVDNP